MKRILAIVFALILTGFAAAAQPKTFGVRLGSGLEISYQHSFSQKRFLEVDAGVIGFSAYPGMRLTASYDFVFMRKNYFFGSLSTYAGPGLTTGMYGKSRFTAGFTAQLGASFDFESIPLSVAIDTRPALVFGQEGLIVEFKSFVPMASLRWKF